MRLWTDVPLVLAFSLVCAAGDNQWTSNGPYGGVFTGFVFHPQNADIVFAWGPPGMFRSRNGGQSWERLTPSAARANEMVVRISPKSPSSMLAAGGDRVFGSTDQGTTWQAIAGPLYKGADGIYDMEFHPTYPQVVYAVTYSHGAMKSTDGGKTWMKRPSSIETADTRGNSIPQVEVDPQTGNSVYVLMANRKAFRTTDGGKTWQEISNGLDLGDCENTLAIDPKNPKVLYAGGCKGVFKTTDSGGKWSKVLDGFTRTVAVDPANSQNVYAVHDKAWKSTNGGSTWSELSVDPNDLWSVAVNPNRTSVVFIGGFGQGVFRSQDAGKSWRLTNTGLDGQYVGRVQAHPDRPKQIFALPYKILYWSQNDAKAWKPATLCSGQEPVWNVTDIQIHEADANLVVASICDPEGSIAISRNGGKTWELRTPNAEEGGSALALDPANEDVIYLACIKGLVPGNPGTGIVKSTDQGETWQRIDSGLTDKDVTAIAVDPTDSSNVYVGTKKGKVFRSTNGGAAWKNSSSGLKDAMIRRITFDPSAPAILYASTWDGIYRSANGGQSWKPWTDAAKGFVTFDPFEPERVFGGGYGALAVSNDHGETWSSFDSTGLGSFWINDVNIDRTKAGKYAIGTNQGVYSYAMKTVQGGPAITQLSPAYGKAGESVTIDGSNFGASQDSSKVLFGTVASAAAQSWSTSSIRVAVPSGAKTGSVTVQVGSKKSNPFEFIVLPATGNVEPTSGPAAGGTLVTILAPAGTSGTQFNVLFGSTLASGIRFVDPNIIICYSPPGTGTADVKVTSSVTSTTVGTFSYQ
ncbi:MAG: IPT/TIG domain-containing protein [Acidobacteriota bacterium]